MNNKEHLKVNFGLLVGGIIIAILGIILIAFSSSSWLVKVIQVSIGIAVIAINGNNIYKLISKVESDHTYKERLLSYIFNVIIGLCLVFAFNTTFRTVVLIVMILIPVLEILYFSRIPGIVPSSLFQIFLGIIVLILGSDGIISIVFIICGVILFFIGILNILSAFSIIKYRNR